MQKSRILQTPGAVIRLHGTMFGLASNGRNSTVKVAHGSVTGISTFDGRAVTIRAGYKAYFAANGPPSQPRPFQDSTRDSEAFALLSIEGAAPMGVRDVGKELPKGTHTAVLVAIDSATLTSVRAALGKQKIKVGGLLASQLQQDPTALANAATTYNTQTVIVAAPAARARSLLDTVHKDAAGLSVVFIDTTS